MRLLVAFVVALVVASAAVGARGDPQERFTAADQARAKAMLLRQADFTREFKGARGVPVSSYCRAIDESDLTLSGKAAAPIFAKVVTRDRVLSASSEARVYSTAPQSDESWRRWTNSAGAACVKRSILLIAKTLGESVVSFRKTTSFNGVAPASISFRIVLRGHGSSGTFHVVRLHHNRANVTLAFSGSPGYPRADQARLVRLTARRMEKAMRGA
jgi:hypothetical protein